MEKIVKIKPQRLLEITEFIKLTYVERWLYKFININKISK